MFLGGEYSPNFISNIFGHPITAPLYYIVLPLQWLARFTNYISSSILLLGWEVFSTEQRIPGLGFESVRVAAGLHLTSAVHPIFRVRGVSK